MNDLPKSPAIDHESVGEPLVGGDVLNIVQVGKGDVSDWMELMEAVEVLCPVWTVRKQHMGQRVSSSFEDHGDGI